MKQADPAKTRSLRLGVLGPSTARCEKCLADCSGSVGEWAVTGLCPAHTEIKAKQQRVAGR